MFTRGRARSGERMLITGIGGGVAMMAMLFGLAAGLEVWVTSSSDSKLTQAVEAGAAGGANYTRPEWAAELGTRLTGKIDLVIDGAGGEGFSELLPVMANRGRMVIYGGTRGPIHGLSPQRIFWKQLDILGSSMGSPDDFQAMLDFVSRHQVRPLVSDVFPMEDANRALALLARGDQSGKVVVRIGQ
jgi:D-arabinose 1-dehydrogenase-like Zn-dependent alcohol dehydrogenase